MSQPTELPPSPPRRGAIRSILVGAAMLAMLWLLAVVAEPYLIAAALSPTDQSAVRDARRSAAGWANSNIWLVAEVLCIATALLTGFLCRRLSPSRSWVAPAVLMFACVVYIFFAQFPATKISWRIALWYLGLPLGLLLGAWLASRWRDAA